ncbi:MAG TPA: PilZ domain-containing protein [Candidatus Acidoferrum sp.]|nr:PilZ domain-containing protein [Candidatus Acidoferrum sp.]
MSEFQQSIGSDRRVHQRLEDVHASLVELSGDHSGIVLNVSEGGMAILSAEDLDENGLRNLRFQAPEFEHWIEADAELAWISESKKQAGIRFKSLSDATRIQLRAGISIAKTRARLATDQAKQAGTTSARSAEITDPVPASLATADSPAVVVSESAQVSNEANTTTLEKVEEAGKIENEGLSHLDMREEQLDSRSSAAQQEIEAKENAVSPEGEKKITQPQPLNSYKNPPQKPPLAAADVRSLPLTPQTSALAEIRFRNIVANSGVKQSGDDYPGILNRPDISYGKWAAVGVVAILASLVAFMIGWILGDPSRVKLGH